MTYCSCGSGESKDLQADDAEVVAAAKAIVDALNRALEEDEEERGRCAKLELKEIKGSYRLCNMHTRESLCFLAVAVVVVFVFIVVDRRVRRPRY